jgi:hypothetical protein
MTYELDRTFSDFEKRSGWSLSLPAKVIIQQGFISLRVDTLGLDNYPDPAHRDQAIRTAASKLPEFLDTLKAEAEKRKHDEKVIGGVFVLQYAKVWENLVDCSCWPI